MRGGLLLSVLLIFIVSFEVYAVSITFKHAENIEIKLQDAVYPEILSFTPQFQYPRATVFQLDESNAHLYLLSLNSKEYYLWVEDLKTDFEIDASNPEMKEANIILVAKDQWNSGKLSATNSELKQLNAIDVYYLEALDSLDQLALADDNYSEETSFNTIVWDHWSAKRLFNFSSENFNQEFDDDLIRYSPSYALYWQLIYKLYYQYFHTNAFKGLTKIEIKSKIDTDFRNPEARLLVFHHFFRYGLPLSELEENYQLFSNELSSREKFLAQSLIQKQKIKETTFKSKIDILFGIDIDGAMEGYIARDSSEKQNVLVFWSIWNNYMAHEFNLLADLKSDYQEDFNFVHICIDAYETPEKTKSFIYQNRVGGFHLLPEQSNAYRKSKYRKDLKIRDLPFYVMMDNDGNIIHSESIPLMISRRLEEKMKNSRTKK